MTGKNTSIGPSNAWLPLCNEQNCEQKSVDEPPSTARSFRSTAMSTYTTQHKVDFGCTGFQTVDYVTSTTEVNKLTEVVAV